MLFGQGQGCSRHRVGSIDKRAETNDRYQMLESMI